MFYRGVTHNLQPNGTPQLNLLHIPALALVSTLVFPLLVSLKAQIKIATRLVDICLVPLVFHHQLAATQIAAHQAAQQDGTFGGATV